MNKVRVLKETKITKIIYRGLEKINSHSVASTQTGPTLVANELESERKSDENWSKWKQKHFGRFPSSSLGESLWSGWTTDQHTL